MGGTMGVPSIILIILGWFSVAAGAFTIVMGGRLLFRAAGGKWKLLGGAGQDQAVDPGKVLEALSKLPQWAVMVIVGYLQILMGFWMLGAKLFGYSMLP
jgi:hypothetical protein